MMDGGATTDTVSRSFPIAPGGRLEIRSDRGSIAIETTGSDQVSVEVQRRVHTDDPELAAKVLAAAVLELSPEDSTLRVKAAWEPEDEWPGIELRFSVTVPRRFDLDLSTHGGSVTVGDLAGEVAAVIRGGSLSCGRIGGAVRAEVSGGSIGLAGCAGGARLVTHGGSIRVGDAGDAVDATSRGGGISVRLTGTPRRDCRLLATGGSLEVAVADSAGFDLQAEAVGGHVHSELSLAAAGETRSLSGSVNGGGAKVSLRAVGGSIKLKRD